MLHRFLIATLAMLIVSPALGRAAATTRPATAPADRAWEVIDGKGFALAVPKGWRDFGGMTAGPVLLFRQGDGIGVPAFDETGSPLQVGLTVERFPKSGESLDAGVQSLLKSAKANPRLKLVGREAVESLKLSDGTEAVILITEFVKDGNRRSLQVKMLANDKEGREYVVSGFLVGGLESKWPTNGSAPAAWLKAHVASFTFDATTMDEAALRQVYARRGEQQ